MDILGMADILQELTAEELEDMVSDISLSSELPLFHPDDPFSPEHLEDYDYPLANEK